MTEPTAPAPEIDIDEVRVQESGCAECARLREEAAGLAAALHRVRLETKDDHARLLAIAALQRWVRS